MVVKRVEGLMANDSKVMRRAVHVLLLWLVAALLAGCSQNAGENTSVTRHLLTTFPVTITIATPNPVLPLAPVVSGSNSLSLGGGAEIVTGVAVSMGSGGLLTQPGALLNETWSRGTAGLNDRVQVRGTLHARTRSNGGGSGSGVVVTTWDQNPALDPVQTLSWQVSYPSGPADDVLLNANQSRSLDPGKYGNVVLNSGSTLTLHTGIYYLTTFSVQSASIIKLDQARGPIIVYVTDSLPLRGNFQPLSGTDPDLLIAYIGTTPVTVESLFNGAVIAPFTSLTLRAVTGTHTGFFFAKDMILDANSKVKYRAPAAIVGGAKPPGATCRTLLPNVPKQSLFKYCKGCDIPLDSDRDGFEDCVDGCKFDPAKSDPGICGCGNSDKDSDGDGTPDCLDACDIDANNVTPGECGCSSTNPLVKKPVAAGTLCTTRGCPGTGTLTCNAAGVCGTPSACNPGGCRMVESNQSTYWFCPGPVTQSAAALACRNRQMSLVRIEGFLENDFLKQLVTKPVWIGANSITTSNAWRWATATNNDGQQFWQGTATGSQQNALFSFWAKGAPASQRCAVIEPGDARWLDVDCNQALGFVCEFRNPITPTGPGTYPPAGGGPGPVPNPMPSTCITSQAAFLPPNPPDHPLPYDANDQANDKGIDQFVAAQNAAKAGQFTGPAQSQPAPNTGNPALKTGTCAEPPGDPELPAGIASAADAANGRGCRFDVISNEPAGFNCQTDDQCTPFGTGLECRQVPDATCMPTTGASPTKCGAKPHCGKVVCPAVQVQPGDQPITACSTIDVCDPGAEFNDDRTSDTLTATDFDPKKMFGGALPVVQPHPYSDDPTGTSGKSHKWCFMDANEDIPAADQNPDTKVGQSNGGGSKIQFNFDPNASFSAHVNPLSLGETDLDVRATASLTTKVTLDGFIGAKYTGDILSAVADIHAHRCTISTKDTKFTVFGLDFISLAGVPQFDTSDKDHDCPNPTLSGDCSGSTLRFKPKTDACNEAVGKFITASNRAKKAFRDAQQLVQQFKAIKAVSAVGTLKDLCKTVVGVVGDTGADVPFFPDGLVCPENEPAEITINRFIDYYQAPGVGQIAQLRDSVKQVADATNAFFNGLRQTYPFGPDPKSESKTLVEAQFQIGPVPCVLEISAFYSYGINGFFEVGLKPPFNPFDDVDESKPQRNPVAFVRAGVVPFANAGLSAFVGAGKSLGPFSATLGIEGKVSLADVRAPIFAGAGLGAEVQVDKRSLAPDIEQTLGALGINDVPTHIGVPKSFKFFIWYEYGAAITVDKILAGEINGRLRIKFAFFSRTWRKRIAKFNGLSGFTINIVSGKLGLDPTTAQDADQVAFTGSDKKPATETASVTAGTTDMGLNESQVPLLVLNTLEPPTDPSQSDPDAGASQAFDAGAVQGMFYDNLCCSKRGEQCLARGERATRGSGKAPCCPGAACKPDSPNSTNFVCTVDCRDPGGACSVDTDCCSVPNFTSTCGDSTCFRCGNVGSNGTGAPCTVVNECCGAGDPTVACLAGHCANQCLPAGTSCTGDSQCCTQNNFQCSTSNQKCCGKARIFGNPPIPGAACNVASDCCGSDLPNNTLVCDNHECVVGIP